MNLSVATTVDFDSSSYVKGQQLKGFIGFFSDVDNTSSASLSAYVEPALEADDIREYMEISPSIKRMDSMMIESISKRWEGLNVP